MTNPLDYTIQNPDAMRYALMQDSSYRKGGAVRMADGGILDGHPVFQTAQVPFAEYRHSIGMNHGGAHFDEGGQASLDQMRYELTHPYGTDYERFVPNTNTFSVNEKPASLAYTQRDVPQVTDSGGVAPVPRTVYDERMDELDKQLNQGVKPDWMSSKDFLRDQAERKGYNTMDTSLAAMGQNVLAALGNSHIPGGAFRAISAPYEAAEKVLGSSMGLDPMAGIIGKTGELHRVPKAGQYAASRVAPFANKVDDMVRELHASGAMPQPGLSIKDVTPRALAPANEQGFYSPTEAAALNLQRKSGNGQAFLNDIMKGENVKPEEISGMGLDTFLKDKKNVTAAEVQDFIAQNKLGLGEGVYGGKAKTLIDAENPRETGFQEFALPGGENYREVVITLPTKGRGLNEIELDKINRRLVDQGYDGLGEEQRAVAMRGGNEAMDMLQDLEDRVGIKTNDLMKTMAGGDPNSQYRSSHFDEPNILAHLRMSDRVTDGKKTLLVDEVQSDWHQAGRDKGYQSEDLNAQIVKDAEKKYTKLITEMNRDPNGPNGWTPENKAKIEQLLPILDGRVGVKPFEGVPDAPYKEDWYQLALRRAIKEAIDGGYDRVAITPAKKQIDRYPEELRANVDHIEYESYVDNSGKKRYEISGVKNGKEIVSKDDLTEKELKGLVGKDIFSKIISSKGESLAAERPLRPDWMRISGEDLSIGGEGMKKYYDEVYPNYLKKFGKKYGATVGKTIVDVDGAAEPLHYMDITPAMRKEFSTGIHMKKGGKVSFANSLDAMRHELSKAK